MNSIVDSRLNNTKVSELQLKRKLSIESDISYNTTVKPVSLNNYNDDEFNEKLEPEFDEYITNLSKDNTDKLSESSELSYNSDENYKISTNMKFKNLEYKKIAIDASLLIYQYVIGIRNTSSDLTSLGGDFTSHIHAVVSKSLLYLDNNITPIFVFDGKPPEMKSDVLIKRRTERLNAKKQYEDEIDESEKIKLFKKSTIVTYKQMEQCKEILRAMGIPVVESLEEADSQLAYLTKEHNVYGAGSEDMDLLAFGATKLLKNISSSKKNNIIEYDLINIQINLQLNTIEFIHLCILLGCDYVEVISGITPKIAYEIIVKHRSIFSFLNSDDSKRYIIPYNYKKQCHAAINYFVKCPHNKVTEKDLKLGVYNVDKIKSLLICKYSYSRTKVEKIISKLRNETTKSPTFHRSEMFEKYPIT